MNHRTQLTAIMLVAILKIGFTAFDPGALWAQNLGKLDAREYRPKWQVGDAWVVQTETRPVQARETTGDKLPGTKVSWRFEVKAVEKISGRDSFRIEAACQVGQNGRPKLKIWIDTKSLVLRQIQSLVTVGGEIRTLTESYEFDSQQPTPVLGPLTALPIDLPLMLAGSTKGAQSFWYETVPGPAGTKALGEVGFAFEIHQSVQTAKPGAKELLSDEFAKDLNLGPAMEVQLRTIDRQVKQIWHPGLPWPAYSDNGLTKSRLIRVIPVQQKQNQ